jgi:beta-lactamase regulating signal transducer with metallopeptidase domain
MINSQTLAHLESAAARMLHASWQGAVLALLVLAISLVCGRRLDPRWRFVLWLVVFARLALPVLPSSPWSMFGWFSQNAWPSVTAGSAPSGQAEQAVPKSASPADIRIPATALEPAAEYRVVPPVVEAPGWSFSWWAGAVSVWLLGVVVLLARIVLGSISLYRAKRLWHAPADPALTAMFERCRQELGILRPVSLWVSDDRLGPATLGCFRSAVVIPRELLGSMAADDLRLILLHELIHVRRRDVPIDRLACLVTAVHWPNPLAWLALACLRRSRELSCDVALLDRVGTQHARHYGHLILSTIEALSGDGFRPAAVGIFGRGLGFSLRHRIRAIAGYRQPSRALISLAGVLVLSLIVVGLTDAENTASIRSEKLLADRVKTAQSQFSAVEAAYHADTVTFDLLLAASADLTTAQLAVAKTDAAKIDVLRENLKRIGKIESQIELLYTAGSRGGEAEKYAAVQFCHQTAEIALIQQQLGLPLTPDPFR